MIRKHCLAHSLLCAGLLSSSAFAAQGLYVSGDVGSSHVEGMPSIDSYNTYNSSLDSQSTAFRVAVGYSKDLNPNFGLGAELGYNNYGSQTYEGSSWYSNNSLKYDYSAVDLLGKFTWHVSSAFDLYAKLGIANEMVDVSGNIASGFDISNNTKVLPELGFGMSYFATEKFSIDLAVYETQGDEVQFSSKEANNLPSITTVLFGVSYYFS